VSTWLDPIRSLAGFVVYFDAACESVLFDRRYRFSAKRVS